MLQRLDISNFQSHESTEIVFDPRLTVLVGSSDHGKTAVLRALCWIVRNRPRGSAFIRHGAAAAEARLEADGVVIIRRKDRKVLNEYIVDGETLVALGSDVPAQVTDRLRLGDINLADQLDRHFLLLDPPGQIARAINEAIHLDQAEAVAKAADAEVRDSRARAKDLAARAGEAEAAAGGLAWLDGARAELEAAREVSERCDKTLARRDGIRAIGQDLAVVGRDLAACRVPAKAAKEAEAIDAELAALGDAAEGLGAVSTILANIRSVEASLERVGPVPTADTEQLDADVREWDEKSRRWDRLVDLVEGLAKGDGERRVLEKKVKAAEGEEHGLLGQLTECPACGQALTEQARRRLLE